MSPKQHSLNVTRGGGMRKCLCGNELTLSACHRFIGGNIRLLSWFSQDKRGKRPWCLTGSVEVKNAGDWWGDKWSLLPPFEVGPTEISEHGSSLNRWISTCIPDWPNLEGHTKFTFSETSLLPKETESMQLKLLGGHKRRVISSSLCVGSHYCLLMTQ